MEENSGKIKAFNRNDEQFLEAFVIFCGLGIQNTQMYETVERAMAKQMVTLEVRLNQGSLYIIHSCFFIGTRLLSLRPAKLGSVINLGSLSLSLFQFTACLCISICSHDIWWIIAF